MPGYTARPLPARRPNSTSAADVPARTKTSIYPEPFVSRMAKREKRPLGDCFGLRHFGVNLTTLAPGGESALMHTHRRQEELVYVLEGHPTLVTESGETRLGPGMCAGFRAQGPAHHLVNRTGENVVILEIGDRLPGDSARYPRDDLQITAREDGTWQFTHKDGTPY